MATGSRRPARTFDPSAFACFRFLARDIGRDGTVTLRYALGDELEFAERFELPLDAPLSEQQLAAADGLLALLHWVAGVSYYKTALPQRVACESGDPPPAAARLLEALYSEGLAELAYENELAGIPRPRFPRAPAHAHGQTAATWEPRRALVPIGGGKDSAVAVEVMRRSGAQLALFSLGDAPPIARTAAAAGLEWHVVRRTLDPQLRALNGAGAINGHVPVTAIVSCVALLLAALRGFDTVAMANERSASQGNVMWDGVEVNHQFSKGLRAELLLRDAVAEAARGVQVFSVLRPASELAIARAFSRLERYHGAFTSCNAIFRSDPALRAASWCCECPKCSFVFLALAPFMDPARLRAIFGRDLLDEEQQFGGFALLAATGGHKPFECVGEEQESIAAMRMLAADERWRDHVVVRRLADEVLAAHAGEGAPEDVLALGSEHSVPEGVMRHVRALLGA